MNKIWIALYGFSAVLTIAAFYGVNYFTEPVNNDDYRGGNGNPALFFPVVLMPFLFCFIYGTVELSMRVAENWLSCKKTWIGIGLSLLYTVVISIWTFRAATEFRIYIVDTKDAYDDPAQFPLLNVFSNDLFFNLYTFLLVVGICFIAGASWSLKRSKDTEPGKL